MRADDDTGEVRPDDAASDTARRRGPPSRRAMVAGAAAATAVFALAAAIAIRSPRALDERLLTLVAAWRPSWLTDLSELMATLGSSDVLVPVSVAAVVLLLAFRRVRAALLLGLAMAAEDVLNPALKALFGLPRPSGNLALHEYANFGFPSGHAMAAATLCTVLTLIAWPTRWRRPALAAGALWALSMGLSRVFLGVHWPSDVVGGWAAGVALALGLGLLVGPTHARERGHRARADQPVDAEEPGARPAAAEASAAQPHTDQPVRVVLFDWGNTLMLDDGQVGPMVAWPRVAAVPGAAGALAALRGRYRLCVATNADDSGEAEVMAALGRVGLASFIDRVFSSRDIGAHKPDPAFYAGVLKGLRADAEARGETDLRADQVVMVGDNYENDVAGARSAGLRAVWLNSASRARSLGDGERGDPEIRTLGELDDALHRMQG